MEKLLEIPVDVDVVVLFVALSTRLKEILYIERTLCIIMRVIFSLKQIADF